MQDTGAAVPMLADLVWQHSRRLRLAAHSAAGRTGCPTASAPYGLGDPRAARVRQECSLDGCLDIVHELLEATHQRLLDRVQAVAADAVREFGPYANTLVQREIAEFQRRRRRDQGLPVKPTRSDGPAARVNDALTAEAGFPAGWLVALFRMIRAYATRCDRTGTVWPLDGWALAKSELDSAPRESGTESAREEINADIRRVLEIATRVVGQPWVHANVWHPLLTAAVPQRLESGFEPVLALDLAADGALWSVFESVYVDARRSGAARGRAFELAFRRVFGTPPVAALDGPLGQILDDIEDEYGLGALARPLRSA